MPTSRIAHDRVPVSGSECSRPMIRLRDGSGVRVNGKPVSVGARPYRNRISSKSHSRDPIDGWLVRSSKQLKREEKEQLMSRFLQAAIVVTSIALSASLAQAQGTVAMAGQYSEANGIIVNIPQNPPNVPCTQASNARCVGRNSWRPTTTVTGPGPIILNGPQVGNRSERPAGQCHGDGPERTRTRGPNGRPGRCADDTGRSRG